MPVKKDRPFCSSGRTRQIEPYCKHCKSPAVKRVLSRVAVLRSEEKRMESLLDPGKLGDLDENDPRSMEKLMKRMGKEFGDELGEGFEGEMEEALAGGETSPEGDL